MTQLLHSPGLWLGIVTIGVLVLLGDTAWRSWTFQGRVADPSELYPRRARPRASYAFGPHAPTLARGPVAGGAARVPRARSGIVPVYMDAAAPHVGATADWSPVGEVAAAGQSLEDWWSERLQQYDGALKRIDEAPRLVDGSAWHPPMVAPWPYYALTTAEHLEQFVQGSMRLHAYREMRVGSTGEFTPREAMALEAMLT
jgi:hypothetical protein